MTNIFLRTNKMRILLLILFLCGLSSVTFAQNTSTTNPPVPVAPKDTDSKGIPVFKNSPDTGSVQNLTLQQCIDYALQHQPAINKSLINVDITKTTNAINLSGLLPQVNASGNLLHYLQQSNTNNNVITGTNTGTTGATPTGTSTGGSRFSNTFVPGVSVSQSIFSPSLLYAAKSAPLYVKQAPEVTDSAKIFLVSSVSKSFYNVLLNLEQITVLKEDTARLGK